MMRMAIAAVAGIGMLSFHSAFAADLLTDGDYYDRSYYDRPYEPQGAIVGPRADIYRGPLAPSPYAPPGGDWLYQPPPYAPDAAILGRRAELYRDLPPARPYAPYDYGRSYEPLPYGRDGAIPRPQAEIARHPPLPPPSYAPPGYGQSYQRSTNCGLYRYWDGERCVDARYVPPYVGPRL